MKKKSNLLLLIPAVILLFITGCKQNTAISNSKLTDYYAKSINGLADVMDGYSQSLETGSNYVYEPAKKQLTWISSTQDKLNEDKSGSKKTKYLSKFLDSLDDEIREYKDNNFDDEKSTEASIGKNRIKFEKSVNVDDSAKVTKAKAKINRSSSRLNKVLKSQPHVDGKTVINSEGEITFKNSSLVPGDKGKQVLELYYDYKNTTNKAQSAFSALLASGSFTQENGDTIADNLVPSAITDVNWAVSHKEESDLETASSAESLKPGATKEYIAFVELKNTNKPLVFKAVDQQSRTALGNIKISLNN